MTNQKKPTPAPRVEVIRRPAPPASTPAAASMPRGPGPTPSPTPRVNTPGPAPRPVGATPAPRPGAGAGFGSGPRRPGGPGGPGGRRFPPRAPRPPPTVEEINALARRERVPARIARGDLEGKMKCRIWRKLHPEEAKRFDQAYALMDQHPELELADAFGVVQSGKSVAEFLAKKARGKLKAEIKEARSSLPGEAIDSWLQHFIDNKDELSVTLGDRTIVDKLAQVQPVAFVFERAGRMEKLQVVLLCRRELWERVNASFERDPKLTRKPVAVQRQPDRRPVADPRPFLPHVGRSIRFELRNGINLVKPLLAVGPFDVLIGEAGEEIFIPLHAMLKWTPLDGA